MRKFRRLILAANTAAAGSGAFALVQGSTMFIPKGDYQHALGLQRVDDESVAAMANDLNSWSGRLMLRTIGLPIFIGHPDMDRQRYPDVRAYGRVLSAAARPDGLLLNVRWGNDGARLLEDGAYAFYSPYWGMLKIGRQADGKPVARPVRLYSVGLTNEPNVPVPALIAANEKELPVSMSDSGETKGASMTLLERLLKLLGLAAEASEDDVVGKVQGMVDEAAAAAQKTSEAQASAQEAQAQAEAAQAAANESAAAADREKTVRESAEHLALETKTALDAANESLKAERGARAKLVLLPAIRDGRIAPADEEAWANEFVVNPEATEAKLAGLKPVVKVEARTGGLKRRQGPGTAGQAFLDAVNERMEKHGESYEAAWANTKRMRPDLHDAMKGGAANA